MVYRKAFPSPIVQVDCLRNGHPESRTRLQGARAPFTSGITGWHGNRDTLTEGRYMSLRVALMMLPICVPVIISPSYMRTHSEDQADTSWVTETLKEA